MAENLERSTGRPNEYKFDRGGIPAEMGPYVGIVVNNVDNTRSGRLQVWIAQFGSVDTDGSPNLTDPTTWRTVRYCSPFYGATKQSGATGVGTYPGNRNSYGMWFTPPELGTKVLCFFVSGDPTMGGYYIGCIPEDGINHMIPAIGAASNFSTNNAAQKQLLEGAPAAAVTEINDIDPKFADDPRFFDKEKPVQSTVEGILVQQGLDKDPIRGPIKSSAQRESPSNCYGISTPGKPIYQGGYSDKTLKTAIEKGQVKLQDIAVIGRQGGHTFVMDDGDIDGNDTLVRIRTAKGHQITMSDDGDSFYITHANGQTWIELGRSGTVDVFSTNSINLRTEGVLNFHADKGINMYSGGTMRIKSKKTLLVNSMENLMLTSENLSLLSSKRTVGVRSDGTLGLQGNSSSWKSSGMLNLSGSVINLNGGQTISVPEPPDIPDTNLPNTAWVANKGWTQSGTFPSVVTRAPTHEPYAGHGKGADVDVNLNSIKYTIPEPGGSTATAYDLVSKQSVQNGLTIERLSAETIAPSEIGPLSIPQVTALTAQAAEKQAARFPAFDADGKLNPGWQYDEFGEPQYQGPRLGTPGVGVGVYGQSVEALVTTGMVKSGALSLINSGVSPESVLKSPSIWSGQFGVNTITDFLSSKTVQNIVQVGLMAAAYIGLTESGVIKSSDDPRVAATFIQPATEYGVAEVNQWVDGVSTSGDTTSDIVVTARQGQYALDFVDYYGEDINLINTPADGTFAPERTEIDQAVADIIGNPKVPVPQYTDTPAVVADPAIAAAAAAGTTVTAYENVLQPDGSIIRVAVNKIAGTNEDGTFRLAPGSNQG